MADLEVQELTARGLPGVWTHGFYDGWSPNYMFWVGTGHNAIGRFYETFGNLVPTTEDRVVRGWSDRAWFRPNPPLPTVNWSLRNNVNYQESGVLLALSDMAARPEALPRAVSGRSASAPSPRRAPRGPPRTSSTARRSGRASCATSRACCGPHGIEVQVADRAFAVAPLWPPPRAERAEGTGAGATGNRRRSARPSGARAGHASPPAASSSVWTSRTLRLADALLDTQYVRGDDRVYDDTGWTARATPGTSSASASSTPRCSPCRCTRGLGGGSARRRRSTGPLLAIDQHRRHRPRPAAHRAARRAHARRRGGVQGGENVAGGDRPRAPGRRTGRDRRRRLIDPEPAHRDVGGDAIRQDSRAGAAADRAASHLVVHPAGGVVPARVRGTQDPIRLHLDPAGRGRTGPAGEVRRDRVSARRCNPAGDRRRHASGAAAALEEDRPHAQPGRGLDRRHAPGTRRRRGGEPGELRRARRPADHGAGHRALGDRVRPRPLGRGAGDAQAQDLGIAAPGDGDRPRQPGRRGVTTTPSPCTSMARRCSEWALSTARSASRGGRAGGAARTTPTCRRGGRTSARRSGRRLDRARRVSELPEDYRAFCRGLPPAPEPTARG